VGIAGFLPQHGAQAEAGGRIKTGGADAAILEGDAFAFAVFEEELAILGAGKGIAGDPGRGVEV
jgi:hypothetical protein